MQGLLLVTRLVLVTKAIIGRDIASSQEERDRRERLALGPIVAHTPDALY